MPIKIWAENVETNAMAQAIDLASLPFAYRHVAIMPDVHAGLGMPIGGVLATINAIVPNAVGVDIGCGMCALRTSLRADEVTRTQLKNVMSRIRKVIPLGFDHQNQVEDEEHLPQGWDLDKLPLINRWMTQARRQVGTLGGGNHFIELQRSDKGDLWIMIHSGSRNVGLKVAKWYADVAKKLNERFYSQTLPGLEFLPVGTPEAKEYTSQMKWCVEFALCNRRLMMTRVLEALQSEIPGTQAVMPFDDREWDAAHPMINIAHNYAAWENHFGNDVIVHRKGATRARTGEIGIIPGSQGSHSYIVEGLGNPNSFMSCSHGAGRKMGRKDACRNLSMADEVQRLEQQGIIHAIRSPRSLDEAPGAYKDIEAVMAQQADLVRPIVQLSPLAVIKGD